jgi:hypothetical protein
MVPLRLAADGVAWLDGFAARNGLNRSDAVRVCLSWAVECEAADGRMSAYVRRLRARGRITAGKALADEEA